MNDVSDDISALMPPGELTGPSVWYGRDYQGSDDWVHHLSGAEIAEVESIAQANAMGREIMELSPETLKFRGLANGWRRSARKFWKVAGLRPCAVCQSKATICVRRRWRSSVSDRISARHARRIGKGTC